MEEKAISKAVSTRLPRYLRCLGELKDSGVEKISSKELAGLLHVTASQIRQDLNNFGGFGQQGFGYKVVSLYDEIAHILGIDEIHNMILVGGGNLGRALAGYANFEKRGFYFRAIFDIDPEIIGGQVRSIPILPMEKMDGFIEENDISIGVIAIPKEAAAGVARKLTDCGIQAIWNFSHVDVELPENVVVENVHLSESLMRLSYNVTRKLKM